MIKDNSNETITYKNKRGSKCTGYDKRPTGPEHSHKQKI